MGRRLLLLLISLSIVQPALSQDWGVTRDPFDKKVMARYKGILKRNPHDSGALRKLLSSYRKYRSIKKLAGEYASRTDGASLVVSGKIKLRQSDRDAALSYFEKAQKLRPNDGRLHLMRAEAYFQSARYKLAENAGSNALANLPKRKNEILRLLVRNAVADKRLSDAISFQKKLSTNSPTNLIQLAELQEQNKQFDDAVANYQTAAKKLSADPPRRFEVLARIGSVRESQGAPEKALEAYDALLAKLKPNHYLRRDVTTRIISIYRARGDTRPLLAKLENKWKKRGYFEYDILAQLSEETGLLTKARNYYQQAIKKSPHELDTHHRLVKLLETMGETKATIAAQERLAKIAPGEARIQIDLAQKYHRVGDTNKALPIAARLRKRFSGDPGTLAMLADIYTQWGKPKLAESTLLQLVRIDPSDPYHLVSLGEHYHLYDKTKLAFATWEKIGKRGNHENFALLGNTYANHGQVAQALKNYTKAIVLKPDNEKYLRERAILLSRAKQFHRASADWEQILAIAEKRDDPVLRDEAIQRYVRMLAYARRLPPKIQIWERQKSNDRTAWLLLAAGYEELGQGPKAEKTMADLVVKEPKNVALREKYASLLQEQRQLDKAVTQWLEVARLAPSRQKEVFSRIAEIKAEDVQDDEALRYAKLALSESKNDPAAYQKLAERYLDMQRYSDAIENFEIVLKMQPNNNSAALKLAALYQDKPDRASQLYRGVLRRSTNEHILETAAREAILIDDLRGDLGGLEKDLAPLAATFSHKPTFSSALIELYRRYIPKIQNSDNERKRVKHRATPLLLRLLVAPTSSPAMKADALLMLDQLGADNINTIVTFAKSDDAKSKLKLRVQAWQMIASARKKSAIPHLKGIYKSPDQSLRAIAAYGLAGLPHASTDDILLEALNTQNPRIIERACAGMRTPRPKVQTKVKEIVAGGIYSSEIRATCLAALPLSVRKNYLSHHHHALRAVATATLDSKDAKTLLKIILTGRDRERAVARLRIVDADATSLLATGIAPGLNEAEVEATLGTLSTSKDYLAGVMREALKDNFAIQRALATLAQASPFFDTSTNLSSQQRARERSITEHLVNSISAEAAATFSTLPIPTQLAFTRLTVPLGSDQWLSLATALDQPIVVQLAAYEAYQTGRNNYARGRQQQIQTRALAHHDHRIITIGITSGRRNINNVDLARLRKSPLAPITMALIEAAIDADREWLAQNLNSEVATIRLAALKKLAQVAPSQARDASEKMTSDPNSAVSKFAKSLHKSPE